MEECGLRVLFMVATGKKEGEVGKLVTKLHRETTSALLIRQCCVITCGAMLRAISCADNLEKGCELKFLTPSKVD